MPLFLFLDEAGNFQCKPDQSKWLVFSAVITNTPTLFSQEFAALRYELHAQGICQERFHATEDKQHVRNRIFELLAGPNNFTVHSVIVRKNKINPTLHKYGVYSIAYKTLLRYLVRFRKLDRVCMIVDTVPDQSQQAVLKATLEARTKEVMQGHGIPFTIHHHNSGSHALLQVADYCAWATYKKCHGDLRSYAYIKDKIRNEFDIFASGDTEYY